MELFIRISINYLTDDGWVISSLAKKWMTVLFPIIIIFNLYNESMNFGFHKYHDPQNTIGYPKIKIYKFLNRLTLGLRRVHVNVHYFLVLFTIRISHHFSHVTPKCYLFVMVPHWAIHHKYHILDLLYCLFAALTTAVAIIRDIRI